MSVTLTLLHCVLLAEKTCRQPHTDAHYCQFQQFQRFKQGILGIATKRGVWTKALPSKVASDSGNADLSGPPRDGGLLCRHTQKYSALTGPAPPQSWREIWAITVSDSRD
ncbi:unnamed protein product [Leuciscus chuanchicus]